MVRIYQYLAQTSAGAPNLVGCLRLFIQYICLYRPYPQAEPMHHIITYIFERPLLIQTGPPLYTGLHINTRN